MPLIQNDCLINKDNALNDTELITNIKQILNLCLYMVVGNYLL